jgi:hypothetical protein
MLPLSFAHSAKNRRRHSPTPAKPAHLRKGNMSALANLFGSDYKKYQVWLKGHSIPGWDDSVWRRDDNGSVIKYSDYGDRSSKHGWEMDHFPLPNIFGGADDVSNLRPLHCISNARHGGLLGSLLNPK